MIHTFELLLPVHYEEVQRLFRKNKINVGKFRYFEGAIKKLNKNIKINFPGYSVTWISQEGKGNWNLNLKVDVPKILGRGEVTEKDYSLVESDIRKFLITVFGHSMHFDEHRLNRIDYRFDAIVPNKDHQRLIFHLFEKYTRKYRFKNKIKYGKNDKGEAIKYEASQYHKNKSVEFIIYSKEDERIAKSEKIEPYEKDVIRYELRLKNRHLNDMKRTDGKGKGRPKKLIEYFKESLYREYMIEHITPIARKGDYYKITKAEKILEASHFTRKKKEKLRLFLVEISNNGIDSPKKNLSTPTYRQYLRDLESLGINPVLIPKNRLDFPTYMKNPFNIIFPN